MSDLDSLSIQITSDSKKAEDAIEGLIRGLTNLNNALGNLDVSKITAFTNAVSKLSNIGSTTNTTSKALRGMSNQLSKTFGIKSKEGIKDLNVALNDFYEATKRSSKDSSLPTQQMYVDSAKALHKAITENASYKKELRDDVRIVKDFYDAQKANGSVFSLKGYKDLFDDKTWAEYKKSLGSVFTFKKFSNQQGVGDIENFFSSLYKKFPDKAFFSDPQNPLDTAEAIKKLVEYLDEARNSTLRYKEAVDSQVISGNEAKEGVIAIGEQLKALVREQNEFSGENGLKGVVSAMQALGSVKLPDMTGVADAVKALNANPPSNTAKAVADIGSNASNSAKQVEELTGKLDKVQRVIEGNEIKDYQRGFTMKDSPKPQSVQYPPAVIEQAEVYQEKLLPAIIDTQNEVDSLYQHMMAISSVEPIYDAITEKFVEWKTQLMEMNGAISGDKWIVPEFKDNADFNRQQVGWISNIKPEVVEGYFYEIEDAAEKCLPAIRDVGTTALALSNQFSFVGENVKKAFDPIEDAIQKAREFKKVISEMESGKRTFDSKQYEDAVKGYDEATKKIKDFKQILKGEMQDAAEKPSLDNIEKGAERVKTTLEEVIEKAREFKQVISEMESGKRAFDPQQYEDAIKGYDQATKKIQEYKKSLTGGTEKPTVTEGVLPQLVVLGKELGELSHKFGELGNKAIGLFKGMVKPLQWASGEYVEKFRGMQETIANFQDKFRFHMKKMSEFWKRTMKTFTFMLVRKAITAIITEVGNAVQSLAMYSNAMGTAFNTDISNMVADFQYLGRSIVSVFAPLLNFIAPIIDAIVDKIATLISYIGMLFAALGGSSSFTKAKKNVGNYAESLDQASKSAKNLTMGIDELNIISDQKSSGSAKPYDGWEDAWEDVEIPDWIKNLADWFKKLWDAFFAPLKEAWERAKQYVIDGFKTMVNSLKQLLSDVGRDFLEVWNQEKTIRMFEQLFRIIGDIERVIRNWANGLDEAWNKNRIGFQILENIRDIFAILVEHARNISYYMIDWSAKIDFYPLLESFEKLTDSAKRLANFLGGVVEDIFVLGILKYINWMIKEGIPHLQHTIAEVIDAFNFTILRNRLKSLWTAIEKMLENIHKGVTNAIGNIGRELAKFTNSSEFNEFLQSLVNITKQITAARVEKVLTGLGKGILAIAKAVVKFVNSSLFQGFIEFIGEWIDKHSSDDIAKILENIALAITAFKFGEFALSKLSGIFKFFSVITALTNLGSIAQGLTGVAGATKALGDSAPSVGLLYNPLSRITGIFPSLTSNLTNTIGAFKNLKTLGISGIFEGIVGSINSFAASLSPLTVLIGSVTTAFLEWKGVEKSASDLARALNGDTDYSVGGSILGIVAKIGIASAAFTAFLGFPAGLVAGLVVGAIAAIKGIKDTVEQINFERIGDAITKQGEMTLSEVKSWYNQATDIIDENINKWKDAERNLTQDRGDIKEYAKEIKNFSSVFENASGVTAGMADKLLKKYEDLKGGIENYIDQSTDALVSNLLAQKAFLESQGVDVDQMIVDIYRGAEEEKKAVDAAVEGVKEAIEGLDGLTEGTKEYEEQMKKVTEAASEANLVMGDYYDTFTNIDTSSAVSEIEALGHSLDLSQYVDNPDDALTAISQQIDEVKATYTEKVGELQAEADRLKEEVELMPNVTDAQKEAFNLSIDHAYTQASEKLATATNQVLSLYSTDLSQQMATVAENAAADWDKGLVSTFLQPYKNKEEYILYQMQQYNNKLVEDGVQKSLQEAYQEIPSNVSEDVVSAMQGVIDTQTQAFEEASFMGTGIMHDDNYNMLTNVLNAVDELDYDTPANTFKTQHYNAMYQAMQGYDYQSLGHLWNTEAGGAVLSNAQLFEDSNKLTANQGAAAFSQEYRDFLAENKETIEALEQTGATYGGSIVEGLNKKIEEDQETTKPILDTWFTKINSWIHNNFAMPFGSPNKKTQEYGKDLVTGLNLGITTNATTTLTAIDTWFTYIQTSLTNKLNEVKTLFNTMLTDIFSGNGWDYITSISTLFMNITTAVNDNIVLLGETLLNEILPMFMETYIVPFFSIDLWQPYFDILLNEVFMPTFETFVVWFDESMQEWWDSHLITWFAPAKWNKEIFDPVKTNYTNRYKTFITWFDKSIKEWWENKMMPYFKVGFWNEKIYEPLRQNREKHYKTLIDWFTRSIKDWWENKLMPYFKVTFWNEKIYEPLKQNRESRYKAFIDWFSKSIKDWWENKLMPYLKVSFWDSEIFNPLKESIQTHFKNFVSWWILSMNLWWTADVVPYFKQDRWQEQFDHIKVVAEEVFSYIERFITENINKAKDSVVNACNSMIESLSDVLNRLHDIEDTLRRLQDMGFDIGNFEMGGFPNEGSLFFAGERGAELIGSVNGRTAVTSNDEITGIREAIAESGNQEAAYLSQLIALTTQLLDKDPVVIGDRDIAEMAESGKNLLGMQIIT